MSEITKRPKPDPKWKVFFAIPVAATTREKLTESLAQSKIRLPARTVDPTSWHITLYFVGAIEPERVSAVIQDLSNQVWPRAFRLTLNRLGAFPNAESARVLWCGLSGAAETQVHHLAETLSSRLESIGFLPDPRAFNGHLTLSRIQTPLDVNALLKTPLNAVEAEVDRFVLFRSLPDRPELYEELASFALQS